MSIFWDFQQVALRQPGAPAIVMLDSVVSYSAVLGLAENIAGGLLRAGLRRGDRVAVHIGNRPELVSVYYGCLCVGAVIVPVSTRLSGEEVEYLIAHSAARFYLGDARVPGSWAEVIEHSDAIEQAWMLDSAGGTAKMQPWNDLLTDEAVIPDGIGPQEFAAIFYTSGTTGRPKGLVTSHATLGAGLDLAAAHGSGRADATYYTINLVNPWGILVLLSCLRRGRPLAMTTTNTPDVVLRMLRTHRCGWIGGAPTAFRRLLDEVRHSGGPVPDLTETACVAGGDACPIDLSREFLETFGTHLQGVYGMTETGGPAILHPSLDSIDEPSIGWPLPGVETKIDSQPGEAGELLLRAPSRPVGIWNGTVVALFDREQWVSTGDIVRRLGDGCLAFVGRKADLIMVEGYPISPLELEQALAEHADVAAVVVFGVPDAITGERTVAMVEPRPGRRGDAAALLEHLSGRIAQYKYPSEITFVDKLPILPSGKVGRQRLAAEYTSSIPDGAGSR